jgi:hypothetical protein
VRPDGAAWDTLGVFGAGQVFWTGTSQEPLLLGASAVRRIDGDRFYYGDGRSFEIGQYDEGGRLVRLIRRPHRPEPVSEDWKERYRSWRLAQLNPSSPLVRRLETGDVHWTGTLPAYSHFLTDADANLWVEEYRWTESADPPPSSAPATWSVFDSTGVWLGQVETPPGLILREVTRDRALGFVVRETGVREIRVHRLETPLG